MTFSGIEGVPDFKCFEYSKKSSDYCLLIPVLNESGRIEPELKRAKDYDIDGVCDIIILDGGSSDSGVEEAMLKSLGVKTLLVKTGAGKQGAQLRMGFRYALDRGYEGFITIDGNNKDSIERTPLFIEKLKEGYDFVQGSRFLPGGAARNTPLHRHLAVKLLHAPLISKAAGQRFTDTTNAFRGYSRRYLTHPDLQIFREVFTGYELLAYLSVSATKLGLRATEIPVERFYPDKGKTPTKISGISGSVELLKILLRTIRGKYDP
ncbi:MAG: glycosyltransferase family 2 protein [Oscillospiraceae bacterium]|nr:glycosyltransferase family 2 protein [Oscillospiraceae bacterium]